MRTIELYRKHKAGDISRDRFLYEVRRDKNLPWITNITSYDDAVKILKNKGVISEAEIKELSPQTKYNAAMKAGDKINATAFSSDSKYTKALRQGNKFVQEIDPVLKKTVEDFGRNLGFETIIEKGTTGFQYEPIVQIRMGRDVREPQIKVVITKDTDKIEGRDNLPDEASERRLGSLIKQIQKKELDVELKSNSLNEATLKDLTKPLAAKLELMGYEIDYDSSFGFMNLEAFKTLPDGSILRMTLSPSEGELQQKNYGGISDEFSTVDVRFTYWTPEITKKLFGLYKTKRLVGRNLPDEGSTNIDLGIGMFDIPIEQSVEKIISMVKNAEQKASQKGGSLNEVDNNVSTNPAVDRVNPYYLKRGVQMLLDKEKELTNDSYIKALNKAALMLQKNPHAFDEEMFANAEDVEKADAKLETQEVKKANHKDKANEMKKAKVKALKEAAIGELKDYLKKKEQINEDSHYRHHIGSEVHTPDGEGKIIEIVGGTFTVEMKDGTYKDFQINTIDHFTQKSQEELPIQKPQPDQTVKDMWANWKGNTFGGMVGDPEHFKKPLDLSKIKQYMEMYKDDKEKIKKLKEALKKLKETKGVIVPAAATSQQVNQIVKTKMPTAKPGDEIEIVRK